MALYNYYRYNLAINYLLSSGVILTNFQVQPNTTYGYYASYTLGYSTGILTGTGSITLAGEDTRDVGYSVDAGYSIPTENSVTQHIDMDGYFQRRRYSVIANYDKGNYINTISAEDGTYPADGMSGDYWYVRQDLAETATLTSPVGGEVWNTTHTLNWTKSNSGVNVDIELSLNNGSTWKRIASNNALLTMNYDFANEIQTTNAKIRIRPVDGVVVGNWFTSGTFTVQHFPEFKMKIGGVLKSSDSGWVKINGELKQISTITIKDNGVLKEV